MHHARLKRAFVEQMSILRASSGLSGDAIGRAMRVSSATISRMCSLPRGVAPSYSDITMLLSVLGADEQTKLRVVDIWAQLRDSSPAFAEYSDVLSANEIEYFEAVQYADAAWINALLEIPVILRTPVYHDALLASLELGVAKEQRWRDLLPLIQVSHTSTCELHVILDESALLRWTIPGFHDQLDALLAAHEKGVIIQVMPFRCGNYAGMTQPFTILTWHEPVMTQVYGGWTLTSREWLSPTSAHTRALLAWDEMKDLGTDPELLPTIVELAHRQRKQGAGTIIPA